jgi:tetratricopeptide (TPR) repeat protein
MARYNRFALSMTQARALECLRAGDYAGAVEVWQSALQRLSEKPESRFTRALCELNIGITYFRMELFFNAAERLHLALSCSYEIPPPTTPAHRALRAEIISALARTYEEMEEYAQSDRYYHEACHEFEAAGDRRRKAETLLRWGKLLQRLGAWIDAANLFNRARREAFELPQSSALVREAERAVERVLKNLHGME